MKSIESIFLSLEGKCRMLISAPAPKEKLIEIASRYHSRFEVIKELYEITDDVEIDVPGTVYISCREGYFAWSG